MTLGPWLRSWLLQIPHATRRSTCVRDAPILIFDPHSRNEACRREAWRRRRCAALHELLHESRNIVVAVGRRGRGTRLVCRIPNLSQRHTRSLFCAAIRLRVNQPLTLVLGARIEHRERLAQASDESQGFSRVQRAAQPAFEQPADAGTGLHRGNGMSMDAESFVAEL